MTSLVAGILLAGTVMAGTVPTGASLVDAVRAGPDAVLDRLVELGRGIDLSSSAEVSAAIGSVAGLPTRRSATSAFAGYTLPGGEIIFNPDLVDRAYLGVALEGCIAAADVRARLRGPEFLPSSSRTAVALYEDTPYRDRPDTAFSFHEATPGCVTGFGITQRKPAA